jgi:hypothetical protein
VRTKLWALSALSSQISEAADTAGIKRVDEVEFQDASVDTVLGGLLRQQRVLRRELASAVNLDQVLDALGFGGRGGGLALY